MRNTLDFLTPRKLQIFSAVYDLESTTLAADRIGLTQSAVSKAVSQLEAQTGLRLFERTPQGLIPTEAAKVLRRHIRWIERELDLAHTELENLGNLKGATISIGAGPVWTLKYLPEILPSFHARHPDVHLDIITGSGDYLVPRINSGTLDIYFGVIDDELQRPDVQIASMFDMTVQAFVRKGHPILCYNRNIASRMIEFPWIGFSHDNAMDAGIQFWCRELGLPIKQLSMKMMSLASMLAVASRTDLVVLAVDDLEQELNNNEFHRVPSVGGLHSIRSGLAVRGSLLDFEPIRYLVSKTKSVVDRRRNATP